MRELSLDHLRTLVAIADLGSLANAARALHLAAPTVTVQIAELESRLGGQLLVRGRGPAQPTALGERWYAVVPQLGLNALARELALQAECLEIDESVEPQRWRFRVERESLRQPGLLEKLQSVLAGFVGKPVRVDIEAGRASDSPALRDTQATRSRQRQAESIILGDPEVQQLLAQFKTARILPGSIKPV